MAYFGVDAQIRVEELCMNFRNQIRTSGRGVPALRVVFLQADKNGNGKLDLIEFEAALANYGLFPSTTDLKCLHKYFDADQDGGVNYTEFLKGLSDPTVSARKSSIMNKCWAILDPQGTGQTSGQSFIDLANNADIGASQLQVYASTRRDGAAGIVTREEFEQYCLEMAQSIPNDDAYVNFFAQQYKAEEDIDGSVDQKTAYGIIALMRQRLITLANGSQEEYHLRNIFRRFDTDRSGSLTTNELAGLLASLGIDCAQSHLIAAFRLIDLNNNGVIDFEEFNQFLIVDPYK